MTTKPHTNCRTCPLAKMPHVPPTGHSSAEYLIVSEHPGDDEAAQGVNFAGGTGKILRSTLEDLGLTHDAIEMIPIGVNPDGTYTHTANFDLEPPELQFLNVVQCVTPRGRDGRYTKPTPEAIEACSPLFNETVAASNAKHIIALGRTALERFIGVDGVRNVLAKPHPQAPEKACWDMYAYRFGHEIKETAFIGGKNKGRTGHVIKSGKSKGLRKLVETPRHVPVARPLRATTVIAALHPSAVAQSGFSTLNNFRAALSHARRSPMDLYVGPRNAVDSAVLLMDQFQHGGPFVAFDIESPPPYRYISRISFATEDLCGSFEWALPATKRLTQFVLGPDSPFEEVVAFNSSYDVPNLETKGNITIDHQKVRCAMIASMLNEPDLRKGLGHVIPRDIFTVPWKHLDDKDAKKYSTMDSQLLALYWPIIKARLMITGQWHFFIEYMMPGLSVLNALTRRGIAVHKPYAEKWKESLKAELASIQEEWDTISDSANYRSPKQMAKLLFETLGLRSRAITDSGAPSTNVKVLEKVLASLKGNREKNCTDPARATRVLEMLMDIRKRVKQLDNYANELAIGEDGCVHPGYLPSGKDYDDALASTLRLAAHHPNIQNQPPIARYMYVPH